MMKSLAAFAATALFALAGPALGQVPEAEAFVTELVAELKTTAEETGEGSAQVRQTLEDNLATEAIGSFLIRGSTAENATDAQRLRYDALFPSYIAAAFADEIGQLTARRIEVKGSLERRPGDVIVKSELYDNAGVMRAGIDWRVRVTEEEGYKLLDVLVERISPLITRRQTFSALVRDQGIDGLLAHMEETITEASATDVAMRGESGNG